MEKMVAYTPDSAVEGISCVVVSPVVGDGVLSGKQSYFSDQFYPPSAVPAATPCNAKDCSSCLVPCADRQRLLASAYDTGPGEYTSAIELEVLRDTFFVDDSCNGGKDEAQLCFQIARRVAEKQRMQTPEVSKDSMSDLEALQMLKGELSQLDDFSTVELTQQISGLVEWFDKVEAALDNAEAIPVISMGHISHEAIRLAANDPVTYLGCEHITEDILLGTDLQCLAHVQEQAQRISQSVDGERLSQAIHDLSQAIYVLMLQSLASD